MATFEGEVFKGEYGYEIIDEHGADFNEVLKNYENKKIHIIVEEIEE